MSDSGSAIVSTAAGQIGVDDGDCPGRGCYLGNGGEWCSEFVSWCYQHAGFPFTGGGEGGWFLSNTTRIRDWFRTNSTYLERADSDWRAFQPTPGDYVYIGRAGAPEREHSGIVEFVDDSGGLHTIEGNNAGRRVGRYVYPDFHTNSTSNAPPDTNGIVVGLGLRCGAQIRLPNGIAGASTSGDHRPPEHAFDGDPDTFWRNRTGQPDRQYLEMHFGGPERTVTKISLTFGNHLPTDALPPLQARLRMPPLASDAREITRERALAWAQVQALLGEQRQLRVELAEAERAAEDPLRLH